VTGTKPSSTKTPGGHDTTRCEKRAPKDEKQELNVLSSVCDRGNREEAKKTHEFYGLLTSGVRKTAAGARKEETGVLIPGGF